VTRSLLGWLAVPLLAYGAVLAALWWGQERLIFRPTPLPPDAPLAQAPDIHEHWVEVDGARLSVLALRLPAPKGVVFYLHGNAGNLATWFTAADFYRRANFDLVMLDYRGYGKSSGRIGSEAQLHADVRAVWRATAPRYAGQRVVLFGRSLGSGLAASLAAEIQPDLTVLVSPYTSLQALARAHYPWVPGALLRYPVRTDLWLPQVRGPVLLLHGAEDALIPPAHARALAERVPHAALHLVPGAGHNDLHLFEAYLAPLREALARL